MLSLGLLKLHGEGQGGSRGWRIAVQVFRKRVLQLRNISALERQSHNKEPPPHLPIFIPKEVKSLLAKNFDFLD